MKTIAELAKQLDPAVVAARGAIRRMVVTLTGTASAAKAIWQLAGFKLPTGDQEVIRAEVFAGVGLFARPPSGNQVEAVVLNVGEDGASPVIVAVRDEKTRAAIAGAVGLDETMLFNSQAFVHVKANGTVEVRKPSGAAVPLATKADVQAVVDWIKKHVHTGVTSGSSSSGPPSAGALAGAGPADPAGTTVLRGQ